MRRAGAQASLAWVLSRSPVVVAIPGARSPEAVRSAVAALELAPPAGSAEPSPGPAKPSLAPSGAEVLLIMGIPGSGKSRLTADLEGYERLNRDDRGGSLAVLARELDRRLGEGVERLVLDNTYLTRASRNLVVETSARHGAGVRCVWLDTPLAQAQVNLVLRQLALFGRLPEPEELRVLAKSQPGLMTPTSQLRAVRELEPPRDDEGFVAVERVPFRRDPASGVPGASGRTRGVRGVGRGAGLPGRGPVGAAARVRLAAARRRHAAGRGRRQLPAPGRPADLLVRPPLPGLVLAFCHDHGVDPARSVLVGTTSRHRALATAVGARFTSPDEALPHVR